jgi:hypothetical protein
MYVKGRQRGKGRRTHSGVMAVRRVVLVLKILEGAE